MDELQKQVELLHNEAELASAEADQQAADLRGQQQRDGEAAEQRLRELQAAKDAAAENHEAAAAQLREQHAQAAAATEQRLAAAQAAADAAAQQAAAEAAHLREDVADLQRRLQEQRDVTDGYVEKHALEMADLKAQYEQAQVRMCPSHTSFFSASRHLMSFTAA